MLGSVRNRTTPLDFPNSFSTHFGECASTNALLNTGQANLSYNPSVNETRTALSAHQREELEHAGENGGYGSGGQGDQRAGVLGGSALVGGRLDPPVGDARTLRGVVGIRHLHAGCLRRP